MVDSIAVWVGGVLNAGAINFERAHGVINLCRRTRPAAETRVEMADILFKRRRGVAFGVICFEIRVDGVVDIDVFVSGLHCFMRQRHDL